MLHPYSGLVVLEKTNNSLCKMTIAEVEELLAALGEVEAVFRGEEGQDNPAAVRVELAVDQVTELVLMEDQ